MAKCNQWTSMPFKELILTKIQQSSLVFSKYLLSKTYEYMLIFEKLAIKTVISHNE